MKLNYFVGILLAMQWIVGVSTTGHGPSPSCCPAISNVKVNNMSIESYIHEKPPCHTGAVRFILKNGNVICSDPMSIWAKHIIKILDNRQSTKAPNKPPLTTTHTSLPGTTTVTMMIPKGTLTTWKPTTFIHTSTKQIPRNTNKLPQWTLMGTIKMTSSTDSKPSVTDFKMNFMTTTKSPLTTTTPIGTSSTWKPTTYIPRGPSTKKLPRNTSNPPHWRATRQITTAKEGKTFSPETTTTSMTSTTKNRVTMTTPKGAPITWKPTAYITHEASIAELPKNTKNLPNWTATRQTVTTKERKTPPLTIRTTSMTRTTEKGVIMTTSNEPSTTQRQVQKTSTTNFKTRTMRCPPLKSKLDRYKGNNIPWTVRRLKKKQKQGLRRLQLNTGCIEV